MMAGLLCFGLACADSKVLVLEQVLQSRFRRSFQIFVFDTIDRDVDFDDVVVVSGGCSVSGEVGVVTEALDDLVVEVAIASILRGSH